MCLCKRVCSLPGFRSVIFFISVTYGLTACSHYRIDPVLSGKEIDAIEVLISAMKASDKKDRGRFPRDLSLEEMRDYLDQLGDGSFRYEKPIRYKKYLIFPLKGYDGHRRFLNAIIVNVDTGEYIGFFLAGT